MPIYYAMKQRMEAWFFNHLNLGLHLLVAILPVTQSSCTLNSRIYELNPSSNSPISPKTISQIAFTQGTDATVLAGDSLKLSVDGAQSDVSYKDEGSGYVSPLLGLYSPSLNTSVLTEMIEAFDSATSARARIKIKIDKMTDSDNLSNAYVADPSTSQTGINTIARSPGGTLWMGHRYLYDWFVSKSTDNGVTFNISDVFPNNDPNFQNASPLKIVTKTDAIVFVAGTNAYPSNSHRYQVRRTLDGGATWTTVDTLGSGNLSFSSANDMVFAANGDLFVTGTLCNSCFPNNLWIIRRSSDNGSSWTTVNSQLGTGAKITMDPVTGALYSLGQLGMTAIIVKSTNGGATWSQVESFTATQGRLTLTGGGGLAARNGTVVYTGTDGLYMFTGSACNGTGTQTGFTAGRYWFTRVSTDHGASWTTAESIQLGGKESDGHGVAITASGSIFVTGATYDFSICSLTPVVRKSANSGATFSTISSPSVAAAYEFNLPYLELDNSGTFYNYGIKTHKNTLTNIWSADTSFMKSVDNGVTWTEGTIPSNFPRDTSGHVLSTDLNGNLLAAGRDTQFSIRKSSDFGATWVNIGVPTYPAGYQQPQAVSLNEFTAGTYMFFGNIQDSTYKSHWTVSKSTNGGAAWSTLDDYTGTANYAVYAYTVD